MRSLTKTSGQISPAPSPTARKVQKRSMASLFGIKSNRHRLSLSHDPEGNAKSELPSRSRLRRYPESLPVHKKRPDQGLTPTDQQEGSRPCASVIRPT